MNLWQSKKTYVLFGFILMLVFTNIRNSSAWYISRKSQIRNFIGEITLIDTRFNRIQVKNELTDRVWKFYVSGRKVEGLVLADRIRVYYRHGNSYAISVVKMTEVQYVEGEQNLGYFIGAPERKLINNQ